MANLLTFSRLLMVPFICWLALTGKGVWAVVIFLLAAATDAFDGKIARMRGEVSDLGKLFDPVADKALQLGTLAVLVKTGFVPLWLVLLLLAKEMALVLGGLVLLRFGVVVSARASGKFASVLLFIALAGGLAGLSAFLPVLYSGAFFSLLAGVDYLIQAVQTLSSKRISG